MTKLLDGLIGELDGALRAVFVAPRAGRPRPLPAARVEGPERLSDAERRHSAGLMRVNHVGEVCAQALYSAQAAATRDPRVRESLLAAAREENDHLAWTAERLAELQSRPSLLNPVWYVGAYALGRLAGLAGDPTSLGFVVETERQVEQHLASHLQALPDADHRSRAIVEVMREDEIAHGAKARREGAKDLPPLIAHAMRGAAKVMTTAAYRI